VPKVGEDKNKKKPEKPIFSLSWGKKPGQTGGRDKIGGAVEVCFETGDPEMQLLTLHREEKNTHNRRSRGERKRKMAKGKTRTERISQIKGVNQKGFKKELKKISSKK